MPQVRPDAGIAGRQGGRGRRAGPPARSVAQIPSRGVPEPRFPRRRPPPRRGFFVPGLWHAAPPVPARAAARLCAPGPFPLRFRTEGVPPCRLTVSCPCAAPSRVDCRRQSTLPFAGGADSRKRRNRRAVPALTIRSATAAAATRATCAPSNAASAPPATTGRSPASREQDSLASDRCAIRPRRESCSQQVRRERFTPGGPKRSSRRSHAATAPWTGPSTRACGASSRTAS